jgi:endonuclease YncB( thermonuclease family)
VFLKHKARTVARVARCVVVAAVVAMLVSACGRHAAAPSARAAERGIVESVGDGDSLRLDDGREVRLVQIDAPELYTDCYGRAARQALRRLAPPGTSVALVADPALDERDRYGRLLRYVLAGGQDLNLTLVAEGAAQPYFFRNERGMHARELLRAATSPRAATRRR